MTNFLAMHNMFCELTSYPAAANLAFNMAKYQPDYPPPFMRVYPAPGRITC